jgi:long-chain acyl-CoA synthetase
MSVVFVTGATGLIGSEFLRRLLTWDEDADVMLLVRPKGPRSPEARIDALLGQLFPGAGAVARIRPRVHAVEGDLRQDRLGLTESTFSTLASSVTSIYHLGADVRFDLPLDDARETHVKGTGRVLELARASARRGQLERFHHVSTFAAGRVDGASWIPEAPPVLDRSFRNSYEQTKAEAEALVLGFTRDVPLTIHRVGIVLGDSRTGWTSKFDVFYMLVRLLLEEAVVQADSLRFPVPQGLMNAVPVDFVADALYALGHLRRGPSGEIFHYTAGARTTSMFEAIQRGTHWYREYLRRTGQPVPNEATLILLDEESPEAMEAALGDLSGEVMAMIRQLTPYGFDKAIYDNEQMMAALAGTPILPPPIASVLQPIVEYPLRTGWGSRPEPRPPLGRPVA